MKRIFYFATVASLLLTGCSGNDETTPAERAEVPVNSSSYPGSFALSVQETYSHDQYPYAKNGKPGLYLDIRTSEIYAYSGNKIDMAVSSEGATMTINLGDVLLVGMLPATGPATAIVDLPETTEHIVIKSGTKENRYNVSVLRDAVKLVPDKGSFTDFGYSLYHRRPDNVFAFIGGTNTTNSHLYDEFLVRLRDAIPSLEDFEFKDGGYIPWPSASNGYWVDFPTKFFRYSDPADFDKAGDVLRDFTAERIVRDDIGVGLWLSNYDDRQYMSWMILRQ